uniref:Uncharacterized mitochondrial protein AtMg00810-like n=1 Tax=Nicotiana tabacum TaxID=4097 RepID=A0A1S3X2N8_TOBAC|nr:PREDICTED: uncharacterized mitochondrial protein AtMg00810-like [Nicotiana tabacum]
MEFSKFNKDILINQRKYTLEIISDLGLGGAKPAWTPLEANIKLTVPELDKLVGTREDQLLEDTSQYQELIGNLLYLTMSRPVQTLSQFMQQPKKSHWDASIRVVKYIKMELGIGILLTSQSSNELNIFCDVD